MHPNALLDSCSELLKQVLKFDHPADMVVSRHFREQRLGPRERATVAETIYTVLRKKSLFTNLALQHFMGEGAAIALPIGTTMLQIVLITLLPTAIGMAIRHRFPGTARRLEKQMGRLAGGLLALIILLLFIREASRLPGFLAQMGLAIALLNVLAMLAGFLAGRLFRLPLAQQVCIAIEVGIQNGTLAIAITAGLLNNPDMAVPAAVYSLLMYVSGFGAVLCGRRLIPSARRA